jgi:hypothetical protein
VAKDTKKPTTPETDLEREVKKALHIAYHVERWKWLSGIAPMTPPGGWVPVPRPATAPAPLHGFIDSGTWIVGEAKRMKADAEIPDNITKTDFAKALAGRMFIAARTNPSIQPIKWRSIFNRLEDWGLWPIDKIPT